MYSRAVGPKSLWLHLPNDLAPRSDMLGVDLYWGLEIRTFVTGRKPDKCRVGCYYVSAGTYLTGGMGSDRLR